MAEKSGFFNSVNGDRKYKADFFAEYFASFIGNGIFPNPSNALQVIADTNMNVIVKAGKAWINGYYYNNDTDLTLTLDTADGVLNRIDKIVLQFNTLSRTISVKIKKGTFASNAVAPALQRDSNAYELALADVYIPKGSINVLQSNITDIRLDSGRCGIVHGTVDQVDTTTLFNQYQTWLNEKKTTYDADMVTWTNQKKSEYENWYNNTIEAEQSEIDAMEAQFQNDFDTWFTSVKNVLSEDTVGNLNNKIDAIPILETAAGTANEITLNEIRFENGYSKTFIVSANNNGVATTVNGKPLYKPNTTNPPNLTKGKAVTIWYDVAKAAFFFKASAEGNTIAAHVLAGDSFSNDDDTGLVGTMQNNGAITITPAATVKTIPQGYHNGLGTVATDSNLISGNIKAGKTIFGVSGKSSVVETSDGTATAGQMLSGSTAYVNGIKITGNIPSKSAATISPSTSVQTIPAGQYLSGIQTIAAITGTANVDQVLEGYTFNSANGIGLTGTATLASLGGKLTASGYCVKPATNTVTFSLGFTPTIVVMNRVAGGSRYISITSTVSTILNLTYVSSEVGGNSYYDTTTHYNGVTIISGGFTAAVTTIGYAYWFAVNA